MRYPKPQRKKIHHWYRPIPWLSSSRLTSKAFFSYSESPSISGSSAKAPSPRSVVVKSVSSSTLALLGSAMDCAGRSWYVEDEGLPDEVKYENSFRGRRREE